MYTEVHPSTKDVQMYLARFERISMAFSECVPVSTMRIIGLPSIQRRYISSSLLKMMLTGAMEESKRKVVLDKLWQYSHAEEMASFV